MPDLILRSETPADAEAITAVTLAAFAPLAISNKTEHWIVLALRAAGALSVSLVAERAGEIVGHLACSPLDLSDGTPGWYGLGPVSVAPALQRQGIGEALMRAGLVQLEALGAAGCCLVGHPEYYRRFGFENVERLGAPGVPSEVFFAMRLRAGPMPQGEARFHAAFRAEGPPG